MFMLWLCFALILIYFILHTLFKYNLNLQNLQVLWIFWIIVIFCGYILFGLHITEGLESPIQIILTWVIYTVMCLTFLNIFILAYFWSVVRNKSGPTGLRGSAGERGNIGLDGKCENDMGSMVCMKELNTYIDNLYKAKTGTNILNSDTQMFPCTYLNNKINTMARSKQYKVVIDNTTILSATNYLKSIWAQWFELLYNATEKPGVWFTDEYADEEYTWTGGVNPFIEIKKYDVYYWGITRSFRPLKAEICRSSPGYESAKFPNKYKTTPPRLKITNTNDYYTIGDSAGSDNNAPAGWFSPNLVTDGDDKYYPVGDVMAAQGPAFDIRKSGKTIVGDTQYYNFFSNNGPDLQTILVSGDVVDPIAYNLRLETRANDWVNLYEMKCPDGYQSLGYVGTSYRSHKNPHTFNSYKCVPKDCVEQVATVNDSNRAWDKLHKYWYWFTYRYTWDFGLHMLNSWLNPDKSAKGENAYNLFKPHFGDPFYKIKDSCLVERETPHDGSYTTTKDVEPENEEYGIGWNGHPYKLDPKYSVFSFLNLVPEGMIVNTGTGRRFYIIHYGGEDVNKYLVLDYNATTSKFDNAIQVSNDKNDAHITYVSKSAKQERQQWKIIIQTDKTKLKLKSFYNNKYAYIGLEPNTGETQFSCVDLDKQDANLKSVNITLSADDIVNATEFTFISSFGTQMDIIDNDYVENTRG